MKTLPTVLTGESFMDFGRKMYFSTLDDSMKDASSDLARPASLTSVQEQGVVDTGEPLSRDLVDGLHSLAVFKRNDVQDRCRKRRLKIGLQAHTL